MTSDRKLDSLERVVADTRRSQEDSSSTLFARLADHKHDGGDVVSGAVAFGRLPTGTGTSQVAVGNHNHLGQDVIGGLRVVASSAGSQLVTSSTTLVNSTSLFMNVSAGVYLMDMWIGTQGAIGGDIKIDWTAPATTLFRWSAIGLDVGTTGGAGNVYTGLSLGVGVPVPFGTSPNVDSLIGKGYFGFSAAGTLQLKFAQNTSNATSTSILQGSYFTLLRIS